MSSPKITIKDLYQLADKMDTKLDNLSTKLEEKFVSKDVFNSEIEPIKTNINELKGTVSRVAWIIIGSVIISGLALLGLK